MCKMATSTTVSNLYLFSFISLALLHSFGEVAAATLSHQVSNRNFEPWLEQSGFNTSFDIAIFGAEIPFHKNEMADLYQGDIMGFGGRMVLASDGKRHLRIRRWPNGIVPYVITGNYSKSQMLSIKLAMRQFEIYTCVRFVKRVREKDYIEIQSKTKNRCWSYVGKMRKQPQQINLGVNGCTSQSTIIHELMHALGFIHEHSRPDRDNYVIIHWENIMKDKKHNFEVDDETFQDVGVPYDTGSIMQYGTYYFAKKNNKPTITAKNGKPIVRSKSFSENDIKEINIIYDCYKKPSQIKKGKKIL